jgi:hypothetical protein
MFISFEERQRESRAPKNSFSTFLLLHQLGAGLPDFSWYNIPKREKYTKLSQNVPSDHKMYQVTTKCTK